MEKFKHIFEKQLIEEIERVGQVIEVPQGKTIISIGQSLRKIPIILSGSVKVYRKDDNGREILLYFVNANESCAMSFTCCMEQQQSEIEAMAEEDVTMMMVPSEMMDSWLVKYPSWKNFVMRTIRTRFNELLKTIDLIAFQKLDDRLLTYLAEHAQKHASPLLQLTHQQIADELATSRVVISRLLKKLENDGKLLLYRNQIKLLSSFTEKV